MKKLVDFRFQYRVNKTNWVDVNDRENIFYLDEKECEDWLESTEDFDKALEWIRKGSFKECIEIGKTLFTRQDKIVYRSNSERYWIDQTHSSCTRKEFESFEVRGIHENFNCSIESLKRHLTADRFCEYLVDHGVKYFL